MILHKIADKIIFNILKRISVGYLEITSISGELLKFGNYEDKLKADLKIKSSALSAPDGGFQHRRICARNASISLNVSLTFSAAVSTLSSGWASSGVSGVLFNSARI